MDKEVFNKVIENLTGMIQNGKEIAGAFDNGRDGLRELRVKDYNRFCNQARALQGKMDKVFQNELYHLIGMGKLTVSQNATLIKLIKELGGYRTVVKTAASLTELTVKTPSIGDSQYQSILTGTVLKTAAAMPDKE